MFNVKNFVRYCCIYTMVAWSAKQEKFSGRPIAPSSSATFCTLALARVLENLFVGSLAIASTEPHNIIYYYFECYNILIIILKKG
jgi:hypothetical protein